MTQEKLFEILKLVGQVYSNDWTRRDSIIEAMDSIEVVEKEWIDSFKRDNPKWYPLDLSKQETWRTHEGCRSCRFCIDENDNLMCDVKIYNGNNLNGYRENLRFKAKLIMPNSFILTLVNEINWELNEFIERSYKEHLQNQKKLWIAEFKQHILA